MASHKDKKIKGKEKSTPAEDSSNQKKKNKKSLKTNERKPERANPNHQKALHNSATEVSMTYLLEI